MGMLRHEWTEEEIAQITRDMNVARAKVYHAWGFTSDEIATLLDISESQVRAIIYKEE